MRLNPYDFIKLVGKWSVQIVALELPRRTVELMIASEPYLGPHLELCRQQVTRSRDTHPVLFTFGTHYRARMTFPRIFPPPMTYDEMVVMVPYVRPTGPLLSGFRGPMVFMPRLFLSQFLPTLGGRLFWGFDKTMARIRYRTEELPSSRPGLPNTYEVSSLAFDAPLLSLQWAVAGDNPQWIPVDQMPSFQLAREIHEQPLLGQIPGTIGPILGSAYWEKLWRYGAVRPITARMRFDAPFIAGVDPGRYEHLEPLSETNLLGAYQLRVPWALWLPRIAQFIQNDAPALAPGNSDASFVQLAEAARARRQHR